MSEQTKDGGAAFPIPLDDRPGAYPAEPGMTLRDYFAAKALLLAYYAESGAPTYGYGGTPGNASYQGVAERAYLMADAMLKARQS